MTKMALNDEKEAGENWGKDWMLLGGTIYQHVDLWGICLAFSCIQESGCPGAGESQAA